MTVFPISDRAYDLGKTADPSARYFGSGADLARPSIDRTQPRPALPKEDAIQVLRVLIVEDNQDTAAMLAALVEAWGFQAAVAETGEQARRLATEFNPRVVLLDLMLPDESGYQVAQDLRREAGQVSFVVVTGLAQPVDQIRSMKAGISYHLVKPVNTSALRTILERYRTVS